MLNPRIRIASAGHDMGIFNFLQDMREFGLRQPECAAGKVTPIENADDFLKEALSIFSPPSPPKPDPAT